MKRQLLALAGVCICCLGMVRGQNGVQMSTTAATSAAVVSVTACTTMLEQAELAYARRIVSGTTATKGVMGEALVGNSFLEKHLATSGHWRSVSPRLGSQGLDHVFVKFDRRTGLLRDIMIGETKYGSSQLGQTKDGLQLGSRWTQKRLSGLGNRYLSLSKVNTCAPVPSIKPHYEMTVTLKNGKTVTFWKNSSTDSWKAGCRPEELAEAQKMARNYGKFFLGAGEGRISYRSRLFHIKPEGNNLVIEIKDASRLDQAGSAAKLKKVGTITLKGVLGKSIKSLPKDVRQHIVNALRKKMPELSEQEIDKLSAKLVEKVKVGDVLKKPGAWQAYGKTALTMGATVVLSTLVDGVIQYASSGEIDPMRLGLTAGATLLGSLTSVGAMKWQWLATLAKSLNCSRIMLAGGVGGIATSLAVTWGAYAMGYGDLKSAMRSTVIGVGATIGGVAASAGTMALVAAYGTASTGTAIASLSGAAATNASLAVLGGGAVSAGGGGMAVGAAVLGGIVTVAAVTVAGAILFSYHLYDSAQETKRISELCRRLDTPSFWKASWENARAVRLVPAY